MKRSNFFALAGLFLVLFSAASSTVAQETYTITADTARVRAEPNTTSQRIATLRFGDSITVLETVEGARVNGSRLWYRIEVNGRTGYVHSSLAKLGTASPSGSSSSRSGSRNSDSSVSCGGATKCSQMTSCEQAKACLAAGRDSLDRDNDGVPCENICPGG